MSQNMLGLTIKMTQNTKNTCNRLQKKHWPIFWEDLLSEKSLRVRFGRLGRALKFEI